MNTNQRPPKTSCPEYHIWNGMKYRCSNDKCCEYSRYGGRGITVDPRWLGSDGFDNFMEDMGPRPSREYSIDRIDNDGHYTPTNCRWATRCQQAEHRSDNKLAVVVEYEGETYFLADWARKFGVEYNIAQSRHASGWTLAEILGDKHRVRRQGIAKRTTGYRGVTLENRVGRKPYRARSRIRSLGEDPRGKGAAKYKNLGRYATAEEAAIARDTAVFLDGRSLEDLNFPIDVLAEISPGVANSERYKSLQV